ncbi:MAG: RNA-guided endonuclease TnpB family protein, partial [Culicoidibacterales bacterium]
MKIAQSYQAEIQSANKQFDETIQIYRKALTYLISVVSNEWDALAELTAKQRINTAEKYIHQTKANPEPKYDFDAKFYKFPSYLRRSAISDAIGIVASFQSNLANYIQERYTAISSGKRFKKQPPRLSLKHFKHPILYKGNMFNKYEGPIMLVKIFKHNDWVWADVKLKQTDFNYLSKQTGVESSPTLVKKGRKYFLQFAYEQSIQLNKKKLAEQTILAIDLGINHSAVCSVIKADGTVTGRYFINQPVEKDRMHTLIKRLRNKQSQSGKKAHMPKIWAKINGYNTQIVNDTVAQISKLIEAHTIDCLVFEYLDFKGGKRQRQMAHKLLMWRYRTIQAKLMTKAHALRCRYAFVNAAHTSKLAFDGSGEVKRNQKNASLCVFKTGKHYNCDLNASYNIGARYFIKEYAKSMSAKAWSQAVAKVPLLERRT